MFEVQSVTLEVPMTVTQKFIIFGPLMQCSPVGCNKLSNYMVSHPGPQHLLCSYSDLF
jgi:hypothetical protein